MMAFQDNFVVSVLVRGKPQREYSNGNTREIKLPFGTEYTVRLKNTNKHLRATAEVSLDGVNICSEGSGQFIIPAGGQIDIERFVGDMNSGRRFKFENLEKAAREGTAQDPTSAENGMLKVRFWTEKPPFSIVSLGGTVLRSKGFSGQSAGMPTGVTMDCWSPSSTTLDASYVTNCASVQGTTIEGSESSQKFSVGESFPVESFYTDISIRLVGQSVQQFIWNVEAKPRQPLKVFYNDKPVQGVKELVWSSDGLMLKLDPDSYKVSTG